MWSIRFFGSRLARWLERWLLVWIVLFAGLGLRWPGPARSAGHHHGITVVLIVLVASVGLGLPATALRAARRNGGRIALMVLAPAVLLPLIAWACSRVVPAGPLRLGVLAAGVAPSEVAAVGLVAVAGGSAAVAAAVLIGSTLVCVLLAGPVLHLLAGAGITFSGESLLLSLLGIVAAPLAGGALLRTRLHGRVDERADRVGSVIGLVSVLVLIWLVAGQAQLGAPLLRAGLALLLFLLGSAGLAFLLTAGIARADRQSLVLPAAMRDFAIAAGIAGQAFGPPSAAALGLYGFLVLLFGAVVVRFRPDRQIRDDRVTGPQSPLHRPAGR